MTRKQVKQRLMEKLVKVQVYRSEAQKTWGRAIADEMFHADLDFLSSVIYLIDNSTKED